MNFFSLFKRKLIYFLSKKIEIDNDGYESKSLDNLFHHYGSDKANKFKNDDEDGHGYSVYYEKHLKKLKNKKINILEIGSYAGASAAAFSKYFDNSKIFCFDINISKFKYTSKSIEVFGVDIKNEKKIKKIIQNIFFKNNINFFDLIIDDGSHQLSEILLSLNFFYNYVKKDGMYIIEDFKHPNYYKYNNDVDDILLDELLNSLINKRHFKSAFFTNEEQTNLMKTIKKINIYKGNLKDSDICFIEK